MFPGTVNKPRGFSDPPPSTAVQPDGYVQGFTWQTTMVKGSLTNNNTLAEPFASISATALLTTQEVSHTGWIRKEGCGVRTWKKRFMILHHGCIYYFKDTDSGAPKGKFALNGYRCETAQERERDDKYPFTFKVVPDEENARTYYFSSPSKSEMEGWINEINKDVRTYCAGAMDPDEMYDYVDAGDFSKPIAKYPTIPKDIPAVHDRKGRTSSLPSTPTNMYVSSLPTSRIPGVPVPPKRPPKKPPSPVDSDSESDCEDGVDSEDLYLDLTSVNQKKSQSEDSSSDDGQECTSPTEVRIPPIPPKRPSINNAGKNNQPEDETDAEPIYLPVLSSAEDEELIKEYHRAKEQQHPKPPPKLPPGKVCPLPKPKPTQPGKVLPIQIPKPKPPPKPPSPTKPTVPLPTPPFPTKRLPTPPTEDKEFDYLPDECYKPDLRKNQAKVFLELGRTIGVYIIHASQTSDTKLVLSVWMAEGIKHYLIFKRNGMFTLDPAVKEERFKDLREMVKYYYTNPLPRSKQYLAAPFAH